MDGKGFFSKRPEIFAERGRTRTRGRLAIPPAASQIGHKIPMKLHGPGREIPRFSSKGAFINDVRFLGGGEV